MPGTPGFRIVEFVELRQRLEVNQSIARLDVEALSLSELADDAPSYAEFHWRIALPLFCLIGALLGLGISRVKPRQGRFARVVPGILIMLVYYLALLINRDALSEGQSPPAMGLWIVHAVFLGVSCFYLKNLSRPVEA